MSKKKKKICGFVSNSFTIFFKLKTPTIYVNILDTIHTHTRKNVKYRLSGTNEKARMKLSDFSERFIKRFSVFDNLRTVSPGPTTDWSRGASYESNASCSNIKDLSQPPKKTKEERTGRWKSSDALLHSHRYSCASRSRGCAL